jgi:hypothetical protein
MIISLVCNINNRMEEKFTSVHRVGGRGLGGRL